MQAFALYFIIVSLFLPKYTYWNAYVCNFTFRTDSRCSPPCWFCKHRCVVCVQPALMRTEINGENILHCSGPCLQIVLQNPGIVCLLPPGFEMVNSPSGRGSRVVLPSGHRVLIHTCQDYTRKDGRYGQYVLMLCISNESLYILYHQFNSLRQLSFGFFISKDDLEPTEPLAPLEKDEERKCLKFMQQLFVLEPIMKRVQDLLIQQGVTEFSLDKMWVIWFQYL